MHKINVEQGTIEWHEQRFGCVTGTRIQNAVGAKWDARKKEWKLGDEKIQSTLMYELLSERMSQNEINDFTSSAMDRGNEQEPFAIKNAAGYTGLDYQPCGMLASSNEFFKFSPDAILEEEGVIIGGLETKCPSGKKHIEYILNDEIPREYFWQVIGPMILDDCVQWWDFCSYDDRNYERNLFIIRAEREEYADLIKAAREQIELFLTKVETVHTGLTF
ncbi:recombinase [Vibrio phage 1.029.O._10N.261.55.A7]|nr:recombinase [Vibrio phage 1.029.O._10N.261.55.A7]